jgi:hypothetical protein
MAITNWNNFIAAGTQESPMTNLLENAFKGYQMGRAPAQMDEEQKQRQLANQLKQLEAEHKPKEFELSDQHQALANSLQQLAVKHMPKQYEQQERLAEANIAKANRPAALKGALANAQAARNQYPEGSREWNEANDYIKKLNTPKSGIQLSSSPDGGIQVSIGGEKGEQATIPGFPAMKRGEVAMYDKQGKPVAIGKPLTEKQQKEESGRLAFNIYHDFLINAQKPYSGKGSTAQFESDIAAYAADPAAKKRIDDLLAADKLLFSTTVKEDATLGGANTNKVYNQLMKSLTTSEVYPLLKEKAKFFLPQGYAADSSLIYNNILNKGTEAGKHLPAFRPYLLNDSKASTSRYSSEELPKPKSPITNENEAKAYYQSLTPTQRELYKKKHLGGK